MRERWRRGYVVATYEACFERLNEKKIYELEVDFKRYWEEFRASTLEKGNYNANLTQKYGDDATTHPIIDEELWQHVVGGSKKGRTCSFGNTRDPNLVLTEESSSGYSSGASSSDAQIQA
ncbi:hypothetical protein L6452_11259 [Arctium lappa]|uniref:Uncharacterized protein n=1 Tax=Arctium lappa TaxID=4217 RepID=A0ACB9DPA4_ARCLA|nr:hypothetical protein L6452_11259 [Arctium lappa]